MHRAIPVDRLREDLSPESGLTTSDVATRLARFGLNHILEATPSGWLQIVKDSAKDPMLAFLVGTGTLFAALGQWTESATLLVAMIPFLGMDAYLHRRTRASVEGLSSRLATQATVMRDGAMTTVDSVALVPGDLVLVRTGDSFPADGIIVQGDRLQADESALTGEAFPVSKAALKTPPPADFDGRVDGQHWGFAGTRLLTGSARMRVLLTGGETVYGEIVRSATLGSHGRTPLQAAVANLVTVLVVSATIVCLALAWIRYHQGHGVIDAILSAVTLAVAALPEEFPVVLTFFLGVGVFRLARRQALVRRAVVVENIGRVSCICSDKTGTITEGRLRLNHVIPGDDLDADRLLEIASLASRRVTGDPVDVAILDFTKRMPACEVIAHFPFTEDRKRETGIAREGSVLVAAVKGAPEVVLSQCDLPATDRSRWVDRVEHFAESGHKVIACALRQLDGEPWPGGEPDRGFHMAGLLCFEDPVRPGVSESLRACRSAGIHVIMVTGDHPATASAVAKEIGLGSNQPCIWDGDELAERVRRGEVLPLRDVDVIARAIPSQKLDLVRSLQATGEIVAVTGDGVNDVPALQAADIGIAMGERGTRSAREVAAIVLLDDNFASIVRAIAEGRQLFINLQLSFQYLLMIHLPLVLTAALIPLAGYPLLYLPIHVVWLELIMHPTALLVFQSPPPKLPLTPVRRQARLRFFSPLRWGMIALIGILVTVLVALGYLRSLGAGLDVEHARAMALLTLTAASAGITAGLTCLRNTAARVVIAGTLILSAMLIQTPSLSALLHLAPLHWDDWAITLTGASCLALLSYASAGQRPHRPSGAGKSATPSSS